MTAPDEVPVWTQANTLSYFWQRISPRFLFLLFALLTGFGWPLYDLAVFSFNDDLYSHIMLIPCISAYLVWISRKNLPAPSAPNRWVASGLLGAGLLVLGAYWGTRPAGTMMVAADRLAMLTTSFLLLFSGLCSWFAGRATVRTIAFPLGFLVFMIPFPTMAIVGIETFLQHSSAAAAFVLFRLSNTSVFYHDLIFQLPGISLEVAPQCSGIHSSLALFITSVVAGRLFLRTPWKQVLLASAVIPLAFLRNGFRIFIIGELCVHVSPDMINSYIHHHGGPVFFILSLIPFFLLVRLLYRSDHPRPESETPAPGK